MASVDLTRIASNIGALNALNSLQNINKQLAAAQGRLSTGNRINSAEDDPAGLTIATKMLARSDGMKVALDNIGDAKNMLSVAEAGMSKMNDILVQMRSKAEQAASDTLGSSERAAIQTQLSAYSQQIDDLVNQTKWNGVKLLDLTTGTKTFQTGVDQGETTTWSLTDKLDPTSLGLSSKVAADTPTASFADATFTAAFGGKTIATSALANNQSDLTTGTGYNIKILSTATNTTQGAATLDPSSQLLTGVTALGNTAAAPGAEMESGHYSLSITNVGAASTSVSYTITNLDDNTWNGTGSMAVANANLVASGGDLVNGAAATLGVNLTVAGGNPLNLVAGQAMNFEYVAHDQAKFELDDNSGVAQTVTAYQGKAATKTYGYATANDNGAVTTQTGRGISFQLNTFANTAAGKKLTFNFAQANNYSVDVSNSSVAGQYMNTVSGAMDKVNTALSNLGSLMARMTFKEDQVSTAQVNVQASYSRIMNANMAEEQVNASKFQILQQTATAMLAQANTAPQNLLTLFR